MPPDLTTAEVVTGFGHLSYPNWAPITTLTVASADGATRTTSGHLGTLPIPASPPLPFDSLPPPPSFLSRFSLKHLLGLNRPMTIHGLDTRTVVDASHWPWRVNGRLFIQFPDNVYKYGSGTLINRHHVLTAAHCLYSAKQKAWAENIFFRPALNGPGNMTPHETWAVRLCCPDAWIQTKAPEFDFGLLILNHAVGETNGWLGLNATTDDATLRSRTALVAGYPEEKSDLKQWQTRESVKAVTPNLLIYETDTTKGESGAAVCHWPRAPQTPVVIGIHTTGADLENRGVRITPAVFNQLVTWMDTW